MEDEIAEVIPLPRRRRIYRDYSDEQLLDGIASTLELLMVTEQTYGRLLEEAKWRNLPPHP